MTQRLFLFLVSYSRLLTVTLNAVPVTRARLYDTSQEVPSDAVRLTGVDRGWRRRWRIYHSFFFIYCLDTQTIALKAVTRFYSSVCADTFHRVSLFTMQFFGVLCRGRYAAQYVRLAINDFKMIRINAIAHAAKMVTLSIFKIVCNNFVCAFPAIHVSQFTNILKKQSSIPGVIQVTSPKPARPQLGSVLWYWAILVNVTKKVLFYGLVTRCAFIAEFKFRRKSLLSLIVRAIKEISNHTTESNTKFQHMKESFA
jgi:hypothetical protein